MGQTWRTPTPAQGPLSDQREAPLADYGSNREAALGLPALSGSETPLLDAASAPSAGGSLEDRLLAAISHGATYAALDELIRTASTAERAAADAAPAVRDAIARSTTLTRGEQLALSAALTEGLLDWSPAIFGKSDFTQFFVVQHGEGPPPAMADMNCWEMILYSAWRLGQLSTERLVAMHANISTDDDPHLNLPMSALGYSKQLPRLDPASGTFPSTGDLVFVDALGGDDVWHVVLAMGGDSGMSLWRDQAVDCSRVTLSDYVASGRVVRYGPPPW